jgi:FkbM family methyltransferase
VLLDFVLDCLAAATIVTEKIDACTHMHGRRMSFFYISRKTMLGKILRAPLHLIPSNTRIPILQGPLRGKQWIAGSGILSCWMGIYEYDKQKVFAAAVQRGFTVYDIGANVGFYSLLASVLTGPDGKVFCFEPVPQNLEYLRRHVELNNLSNCTVWDAAVGSYEGTSSFDLGTNRAQGHLTTESNGTLIVRTVTLDGLVASGKLPPPDLIKCDIEGAEYDALTGASGILAKYGPTIFLSTHGGDVHRRCCMLLKDLHYSLTSLDGLPLDRTYELLAIRQKACSEESAPRSPAPESGSGRLQ